MNLIRDLWRGDVPLWKIFWFYYITTIPLLFLIEDYMMKGILSFSPGPVGTVFDSVNLTLTETLLYLADAGLILYVAFFSLIYLPFILIGVWRSADKYQGRKIYSYLAKFVIITTWGNLLKSVLVLLNIDPN